MQKASSRTNKESILPQADKTGRTATWKYLFLDERDYGEYRSRKYHHAADSHQYRLGELDPKFEPNIGYNESV